MPSKTSSPIFLKNKIYLICKEKWDIQKLIFYIWHLFFSQVITLKKTSFCDKHNVPEEDKDSPLKLSLGIRRGFAAL